MSNVQWSLPGSLLSFKRHQHNCVMIIAGRMSNQAFYQWFFVLYLVVATKLEDFNGRGHGNIGKLAGPNIGIILER